MKEMIKTGVILLLICAVAALALAFTNAATADKIVEQREIIANKAKQDVLPIAKTFVDLNSELVEGIREAFPVVSEAYIGKDASGEVVGLVFKSLPGGYGGAIEVITGIDLDGAVTGVRMGTHQETPGLGAKGKEPEFYKQYDGKRADAPIEVVKSPPSGNEIQAISGATISSRGITSGVNASGEAYQWILENGGVKE